MTSASDLLKSPLGSTDEGNGNVELIKTPLFGEVESVVGDTKKRITDQKAKIIEESAEADEIGTLSGDFALEGVDARVERIIGNEEEKARQRSEERIQGIAVSSLPIEERLTLIENERSSFGETERPTLDSAFMTSQANLPGDNQTETNTQAWLASKRPDLFGNEDLKEFQFVASAEVFRDSEMGQSVASHIVQAIPKGLIPTFSFRINDMVNRSFASVGLPRVEFIGKPGDSLIELRKAIRDLPPEQSKVLLKNTLEEIRETATWFARDDVEAVDFIELILTDFDATDDQLKNEATLINVLAAVDWIPGGVQVARGLLKIGKKKLPISTARRLEQANASKAAKKFNEALTIEDDSIARNLGTTKEQIANDNLIPDEAVDDKPRVGPDLNASLMPEVDPFAAETLYTTREINAKLEGVERSIKERVTTNAKAIQVGEPIVHIPKINVGLSEDGNSVFGRFRVSGNGPNYGSNTVGDVLDSASMFDDAIAAGEVKVLKRNLGTGEYDEIGVAKFGDGKFKLDQDIDEEGEYLAEIERKFTYGVGDTLDLDDISIGYGGAIDKFSSLSSTFNEQTRSAINNAQLATAQKTRDLKKVIAPFFKMSGNKQARTYEIMDEAERLGEDFDTSRLVQMARGDADVINGFNMYRELADEIYRVNDAKLVRDMESSGHKIISSGSSSPDAFEELALPIDRDNLSSELSGVKSVYDIDSGKTIEFGNVSDISDIGAVVKFTKPITSNGQQFNYGIALSRNIRDLPESGLLRKIPYWMPKKYDITHKIEVREKEKIVDGNLVRTVDGTMGPEDGWSTLKVENGSGQLLRYMELLNKSNDGSVEYRVQEVRELRDTSGIDTYNHFKDNGSLIFSKRSEERVGIAGGRKLAGIQESFESAIAMTARSVGVDRYLDNMISRWEKRFSNTLGIESIPFNKPIPRPANKALMDEWKQAVSSRDHIALMAGVDKGNVGRMVRSITTTMGDAVVGAGNSSIRNAMGAFLFNRAIKTDVSNGLKNTAFTVWMALNPLRQAVMQVQQKTVYMGMDGGSRYLLSGSHAKDKLAMYMSLATRTLSKRSHQKMMDRVVSDESSRAGKSARKGEIDRLVDAWDRIYPSVDSHVFASNMALDPRANGGLNFSGVIGKLGSHPTKAVMAVENTTKKMIRAAQVVGFNAGEASQKMSAFLFSKNRWQVRNPDIADKWDAPRNIEKIISDTEDVAFNPVFKLRQNVGLMGVALQFTSHAQRAAQALMPRQMFGTNIPFGKLGSEAYSNREKGRIAVIQTLLYGAPLAGMINALWDQNVQEKGINVSVENNRRIKEVLSQGLLGSFVNHSFRTIDEEGEWSQVNFRPFGPITGVVEGSPIAKIAGAAITTDDTMLEILLGPSGSMIKQMSQAAVDVVALYKLPPVPEDDNDFIKAIEITARLAPIYGNTYKARLFEAGNSRFATASGVEGSTIKGRGEVWAKALLGLRTVTEEGEFQLRSITYDERNELAESAKTYVRQLRRMGKDPDNFTDKQLIDFHNHSMLGFRIGHGKVKAQYIVEAIREQLFSHPLADDPHPEYTRLFKSIMSGRVIPSGSLVKDIERVDATVFGGEAMKEELVRFAKIHEEFNEDSINRSEEVLLND